MEADGQQPDNSPSASSGQATVGDRLQFTAPSVFKAVGLGGSQASSQQFLKLLLLIPKKKYNFKMFYFQIQI